MRIFLVKYNYKCGSQSILVSANSVEECEERAKTFLKETPSEIYEMNFDESVVLGSADIIGSYLFLQKKN